MRLLILDTHYPLFIHHHYAQRVGLDDQPYTVQERALQNSHFAIVGVYAKHLSELGHTTMDVHANVEPMQKKWAKEKGIEWYEKTTNHFVLRRGIVPWVRRIRDSRWFNDILLAQIESFQPDVIYNQDPHLFKGTLLSEIRKRTRFLIGQIASPIPQDLNYDAYDLFISSLPNLVSHFHSKGKKAEFLRLAFEPSILDTLPPQPKDISVSFIGTLDPIHSERLELLRYLATRCELNLFGIGVESLPATDMLARYHQGPVWGRGMYEILMRSKLTLNIHSDVAGPHANNMRLFEATGVGTALLTDAKSDLGNYFVPGKEVISFSSKEECLEKILHYLSHNTERQDIAVAGQHRTLKDHTYAVRMRELDAILQKHFAGATRQSVVDLHSPTASL